MKLGIVGSEAAKFTKETEQTARNVISNLIQREQPATIISGGCHLGGIDKWAAEIGREYRLEVIEHLPRKLQWEDGYKQRNLLIASESDMVVCITVKELPPNYVGMRFNGCYHCDSILHVKSGGCWTMLKAEKLGKRTELIVI